MSVSEEFTTDNQSHKPADVGKPLSCKGLGTFTLVFIVQCGNKTPKLMMTDSGLTDRFPIIGHKTHYVCVCVRQREENLYPVVLSYQRH